MAGGRPLVTSPSGLSPTPTDGQGVTLHPFLPSFPPPTLARSSSLADRPWGQELHPNHSEIAPNYALISEFRLGTGLTGRPAERFEQRAAHDLNFSHWTIWTNFVCKWRSSSNS